MNKSTITLSSDKLLAALLFAGDNDVRYYLNGVQVEATESQTRLHSTDGHTGSVQRSLVSNVLAHGADA